MKGTKLVIDVTGEASGCVTFIDSYQRVGSPFLRERIERMRLARLTDPGFGDRLAMFPEAVEEAEIFHRKEKKHSSYGRCGECEYCDRCMVCPVSIGNIPGNTDPNRIPDFPCAFNLVTLKHASRFSRLDPTDVLLGGGMRRRKAEFAELVGRRAD